MPDHYLPIIDLGLTVQQAIDRGSGHRVGRPQDGAAERVDPQRCRAGLVRRQQADAAGRTATTYYHCLAVRAERLQLPTGLAAWIEAQLQADGVTPKIVPPSRVLDDTSHGQRRDMLDDLVLAEIDRRIDREAIVNELLERHPELIADVNEDRVREWFAAEDENIFAPWQGAVKGLIQGDFDAVDELHDSVVELLVEQLEEGQ